MSENYIQPTPADISVFVEDEHFVFRSDTSSLYTYDRDEPGRSNCNNACAKTWPPVAVSSNATAVGDWSPIVRPDTSKQWAYKGKPVYTYSHDRPGQTTGDGVDGVWHVVKP
jgi:predicted lipoprotein with Yx(FWY)xxD motif